MVAGAGRYDSFVSTFAAQNNDLLASAVKSDSPQRPTGVMQIISTHLELITPENMTPELYAQFLMAKDDYATLEIAMKHVPTFGLGKKNLCKRIQATLAGATGNATPSSGAKGKLGTLARIPARMKHLFGLDVPTKSGLIGEFQSGERNASRLKENLVGLVMIGSQETEKAERKTDGVGLPPADNASIRGEFMASAEKMAAFIQEQKPEVQEKILNSLASKDCTATMLFLLMAKGTSLTPQRLDISILFRAMTAADPGVRAKFLDPPSGMVDFIQQQTPEIQGKILDALASPRCAVAMSVLSHAKEMRLPLNGTFFDDLCREPTAGRLHVHLNAGELIQSCAITRVDDEQSKERVKGEGILAFFEGSEIRSDFFTNEKFEERLDSVATRLADLTFIHDVPRMLPVMKMIINGKTIDLSGCPQNVSFTDVAKFFLEQLKNSGLSPDQAFKALKSLCRYPWVQGEATRPLTAMNTGFLQNNDAASFLASETFVANSYRDEGVAYRINVEFSAEGNLKISSMIVMDSGVCNSAKNQKSLKGRESQFPHLDLSKCYFTGFTSMECTPEGKATMLDSMLTCHI
jgi:hypothetical protein